MWLGLQRRTHEDDGGKQYISLTLRGPVRIADFPGSSLEVREGWVAEGRGVGGWGEKREGSGGGQVGRRTVKVKQEYLVGGSWYL